MHTNDGQTHTGRGALPFDGTGFKLPTMIENFGDLPPEERARLVEAERVSIEASTAQMKEQNDRLEEKVRQLQELARRREAFVARLEEQLFQVRAEDAELRSEKERILTTV